MCTQRIHALRVVAQSRFHPGLPLRISRFCGQAQYSIVGSPGTFCSRCSWNPICEGSRPMITHPWLKTLPLALAVALLVTAALQAQAPAPPPPPSVKVGQEAPDFTANYLMPPDANGRRQRKEVKLSDFKGQKNVVLAFFPAAFSS